MMDGKSNLYFGYLAYSSVMEYIKQYLHLENMVNHKYDIIIKI